MIENESGERKRFINSKINERQHLINSLKGEDQAEKAIEDLFRQEKKVRRQNKKVAKQRALENMKRL